MSLLLFTVISSILNRTEDLLVVRNEISSSYYYFYFSERAGKGLSPQISSAATAATSAAPAAPASPNGAGAGGVAPDFERPAATAATAGPECCLRALTGAPRSAPAPRSAAAATADASATGLDPRQ